MRKRGADMKKIRMTKAMMCVLAAAYIMLFVNVSFGQEKSAESPEAEI